MTQNDMHVANARDRAWKGYKRRHPVRAFLWNVFSISFIVALLALLIGGKPGCRYYECGQICDARDHDRFWTYSQGCFCLDENGNPYNPKDGQ